MRATWCQTQIIDRIGIVCDTELSFVVKHRLSSWLFFVSDNFFPCTFYAKGFHGGYFCARV